MGVFVLPASCLHLRRNARLSPPHPHLTSPSEEGEG